MAIDKLFAHFKTEAGFKAKLDAGEINENGISLIKEKHQFYTHGEYYNCSLTDEQVEAFIKAAIVNDLTTGGADKTLSAEQGKVLKEALDQLQVDLEAQTEIVGKIIEASGLNSDGSFPNTLADSNYLADATNVVDGLKKVDAQLKPILFPAAAFNISASSASEQIAAIFTDELVAEIKENRAKFRSVFLTDSATPAPSYQQLPVSLRYSENSGAVTITAMYVLNGGLYARIFTKSAEGVWSITSNIASPILTVSSLINDLTTGGDKAPLTAEQGKVLKGMIDALQGDFDTYKQESENKFEKVENKNAANGYAGLDENGKIDPSLVDGVVGHVLGLEQFVDANPEPVEDGKYYFNKTSKKILSGQGDAWVETDPQPQVLYNRRGDDENGHANTLYRWDGEQMVAVSDPIVIGELTGTAYDGKKGADNRAAIISAPEVVSQIGSPTANADAVIIPTMKAAKKADNMGYEAAVEAPITIPAATSTTAGLMSAADKAKIDAQLGTGEPGEGETLPEKIENIQNEVAALKENTVNGKKISENPVINGADVKLDGFTPLADKAEGYTESELTPAATDTVNQAFAKLLRAILDNEEVEAAAINQLNSALGFNENGEYVPTSADLSGKNVTEAIDYVAGLVGGTAITDKINEVVTEKITELVNGASEGFRTLKDLEDALKAEIARAKAAEEALASQLEWYEGD